VHKSSNVTMYTLNTSPKPSKPWNTPRQ